MGRRIKRRLPQRGDTRDGQKSIFYIAGGDGTVLKETAGLGNQEANGLVWMRDRTCEWKGVNERGSCCLYSPHLECVEMPKLLSVLLGFIKLRPAMGVFATMPVPPMLTKKSTEGTLPCTSSMARQ